MAKQKSIYPPAIRFFRIVFPLLEVVSLKMAVRLAVKLFLTPVRFPFREKEKEIMATYTKRSLQLNGKQIIYFEKGSGPVVVCMHGWSGRGMQFRVIAEHLIQAGYTCVLIDAPGHGLSEGKMTNLFEFVEAFEAVVARYPEIKATIGHSLGAACISYAIANGFSVPAFVSIAAPVIAQDILDTFSNTVNASRSVQEGIRDKSLETFDIPFDDATMQVTFKRTHCPVLAIHGDEDRDVSITHLDRLKHLRPDCDTKVIDGVGHRRILKDDRAIETILDWVQRLK